LAGGKQRALQSIAALYGTTVPERHVVEASALACCGVAARRRALSLPAAVDFTGDAQWITTT